MTTARAAMCTLVVGLTAAMLAPSAAAAAEAQQAKPTIRFGANALTHPYIRDTIGFNLRNETIPRNAIRSLSDAEILRLLREGKLDAGSVFFRIAPAGGANAANQPAEDAALLPKGAIVHPVGRLGAWVLAPAGRNLPRLTVDQLADILSGKITKWSQLSAGEGEIVVAYDDASLAAACMVAGIAQPRVSDSSRWVKDPANGRMTLNHMVDDAMVAEQDRLSKQPARAATTDNYLLIASGVQILQADQGRTKTKRFVPIAPSANRPAVAPDLKTVGDGGYPLLVDWRIIVRPDAPETVQGAAKICLRSYESGLVNAAYVKEWLIQPARGDQPDMIRVFYYRGQDAIEEAARAYGKAHPEARFANVTTVEISVAEAFAEKADLLVAVGSLPSHQGKTPAEMCGPGVTELALGRQPVLLLVSQECPLTALTLDQARRVASHDLTDWKDLGWDCGQGVVKHALGYSLLNDALFGGPGKMKRVHNFPMSHPISKGFTEEEMRAEGEAFRKHNKLTYMTEAQMLKAVAADKYGLCFVAAGESSLGSGLKVLHVGVTASTAAAPKAASVASGAYPIALPARVLVHPKAPQAARDFAAWLQSPRAAEVLATHHIYSEALATKPQAGAPVAGAAPPKVKGFAGQVSGAAAVLPTEVLSKYFLMAKPEHLAAYEDAICKTIAEDGRLKVVDREHLDKVLRERQYAILTGQAQSTPAVSADVFVVPAVVADGHASALRVRFVHGPTASTLGELSLPVNPADPTRFDPPLPQALAPAWQAALARLAEARSRPSWTLLGVYPDTQADMDQAEKIDQQLARSLRADKRLFFCETLDVEAAQQEMLMAIMGAGQPMTGGFRPDSDFLLEGKCRGGKLELLVRSGANLVPLAGASFDIGADEQIAQWLAAQAERTRAAAAATDAASAADRAGAQAKLEFEIARRIGEEIEARNRQAEQRRVTAGLTKIMDDDAEVIRAMSARRLTHMTRAVQLKADDEEICQAFVGALESGSSRFTTRVRTAQMYERLARLFPNSQNHRGNMEYAINDYSTVANWLRKSSGGFGGSGVSRGIDHAKLRLVYLGKALSLYESYAVRYAKCFDKPKESRGSWIWFPGLMDQYLYRVGEYALLSNAGEKEMDAMVAHWSAIFDDKPAAGPHSDFLRLRLIALNNDRAGFLKLLTDMQQRHPKPKDPYWLIGACVAQEDMYRLFGHGTDRCNFAKWLAGSRGIGGLPYDGYDPAKDSSQPAAINIE